MEQQLSPDQLANQQPMLLGLSSFFFALQTLAVAFRFLAKYKCNIRWGWDDFWIVCGWTIGVGIFAATIADVVDGGAGRHVAYIEATDPEKLVIIKKIIVAFSIMYLAAVVPSKFVLIHLYLRIFTQKVFRIICWVVVGMVLTNWFASMIVVFRICVPFDQMWDPTPDGYCGNQNLFYIWLSFANIVTDIIILVLPIRYVLQIQISITLRIGILFTFLLGSIGLVVSVIRFVEFSNSQIQDDWTWIAGRLTTWTLIEPAVYNIAACLPSYPPLLKKWFKWITGRPTVDSKSGRYKTDYARFKKDSRIRHNQLKDDTIQLHDIQNLCSGGSVSQSENSMRESDSKGIRVTHRVDFESVPV